MKLRRNAPYASWGRARCTTARSAVTAGSPNGMPRRSTASADAREGKKKEADGEEVELRERGCDTLRRSGTSSVGFLVSFFFENRQNGLKLADNLVAQFLDRTKH